MRRRSPTFKPDHLQWQTGHGIGKVRKAREQLAAAKQGISVRVEAGAITQALVQLGSL
jgi:hypothetical protein